MSPFARLLTWRLSATSPTEVVAPVIGADRLPTVLVTPLIGVETLPPVRSPIVLVTLPIGAERLLMLVVSALIGELTSATSATLSRSVTAPVLLTPSRTSVR